MKATFLQTVANRVHTLPKRTFAQLILFAKKHHSAIVVMSALVVFGAYFVREYFRDRWRDSVNILQRAEAQNELLEAIHDQSPVRLSATDEMLYRGYKFQIDVAPEHKMKKATVNTEAVKHHLDEAYFDLQLTTKLLGSLQEVIGDHTAPKLGADDLSSIRLLGNETGPTEPKPERKTIQELNVLSSALSEWIARGYRMSDQLKVQNSVLPLGMRAPSGFAYIGLYGEDPDLPGFEAYQIHLASHVLLRDTRTTIEWWIDREQSKERVASVMLSIIFLLGWAASSIGKLTGDHGDEEEVIE